MPFHTNRRLLPARQFKNTNNVANNSIHKKNLYFYVKINSKINLNLYFYIDSIDVQAIFLLYFFIRLT